MIDLDHFKQVNDAHGHDAGDMVLRKFAEILKSNTRLSDISGRIGGEEFLQVLTHADGANVGLVLERIRSRFEAEKFVANGAEFVVTASFGVAGFSGEKAPEFAELVVRADAALYRAKHRGRNYVEIDPIAVPR
jgi:diguanylate cyclase